MSWDYSPGGQTQSARRRMNARRAGIASGVARRQRSRGRPPRARSGQQAAALHYPQPGISRKQFDQVYEREHPRPQEAPQIAMDKWDQGRQTAWMIVRALERWWRKCGQHFNCTNDQILVTLERLGLGRSKRQLQRIRKLLEAIGYGAAAHVRRGGSEPGNRDCLKFERRWTGRLCKSAHTCVTPPSGAGAQSLRDMRAPASQATALSAPPTAARKRRRPATRSYDTSMRRRAMTDRETQIAEDRLWKEQSDRFREQIRKSKADLQALLLELGEGEPDATT